jgi:hypothetical protein
MPISEMQLSEMQEKFARQYAATRNATYAATAAGYKQPGVKGAQLRADVAVSARVHQLIQEKFMRYAEDVPDVLASIMYNPASKGADRIKAATLIAAGTGYVAPKSLDQLEPHEMTPDQLAQALDLKRREADALEVVAADRARLVDGVTIDEHTSSIDDRGDIFG